MGSRTGLDLLETRKYHPSAGIMRQKLSHKYNFKDVIKIAVRKLRHKWNTKASATLSEMAGSDWGGSSL